MLRGCDVAPRNKELFSLRTVLGVEKSFMLRHATTQPRNIGYLISSSSSRCEKNRERHLRMCGDRRMSSEPSLPRLLRLSLRPNRKRRCPSSHGCFPHINDIRQFSEKSDRNATDLRTATVATPSLQPKVRRRMETEGDGWRRIGSKSVSVRHTPTSSVSERFRTTVHRMSLLPRLVCAVRPKV